MQTTTVPIDQVIPYARNPRKNAAAVDKVAASIKEFGWRQPIVVNKDSVIIAGHTRLLAAQKLGMTKVPVHVADLTDTQAKAYRLADNRVAEYATWDDELLGLEIRELDDMEFDLDLVGFEDKELAGLLLDPSVGTTEEDEVPEPPANPITKSGDLWKLGEHRVLCGDSTSTDEMATLIDGTKAALVFTDPPYGVDIQETDLKQAEVRGRRKDGKGVANDDLAGDELRAFLERALFNVFTSTRPGACWYVCAPPGVDYRHPLNVLSELGVARHGLAWVKDRFVMGRCDYHYRHENIIYGWTPGGAHHPVPTRDQDSVWECPRPGSSPEHPTMKPVELVARAIGNSSDLGELILDPFLGSGTTLIAAEQLSRKCYGMELSPAYCDVIIQRWENLTGGKAERGN